MSGARVTPCIYLIPEGFTGWVTIELAVAGAPPLSREGGARLIAVPPSGRLKTSSPQELGIIDDHEFWFVDAHGVRTRIDHPETHHGADPNAAWKAYRHPVVLSFCTGEALDTDGRHVFERFYIGAGPAGDPPGWP
jgi:hypothetical protein